MFSVKNNIKGESQIIPDSRLNNQHKFKSICHHVLKLSLSITCVYNVIRLFKTEDTHLVPPWRKSRSSVNNVKSLIYYKMKLIHHSKARSEFELINDIIIIITHNAIRYFKTEDTHLYPPWRKSRSSVNNVKSLIYIIK